MAQVVRARVLGLMVLPLALLVCAPAEARNDGEAGVAIEAHDVEAGADSRSWARDGVCAARDGRLPDSVRVETALVPRIQFMLERSRTFREQCRRLAAAPWVHVAVRLGPYFIERLGYLAYSTIQRPQPKLLVAVVTLQASAEPALWIPHEFEHLVEQIDQVDVARLASRLREAWPSRNGTVETERAVRAGMRIFDEVREAALPDNLVE